MSGLVTAILRQQGRAQAMQAHAVRLAVWGEAEDFGGLMDQLNGVKPRVIADADELAAALGGL